MWVKYEMLTAYELFDLTNGFNILRIACGALFIPHIYAAFFVPEALDFFIKAKFRPPVAWLCLAATIELALAVGLIFGIYANFVAIVAAVYLGVVAGALYRVSGGKWLWNIGGCEFPVFWAICCIVIAIHS